MKRQELEGVLVSKAAVEKELAPFLMAARDRLLNVPARLGPILATEREITKCIALLDAEMRDALTDLAEGNIAVSAARSSIA
jgi:hypothetical protein